MGEYTREALEAINEGLRAALVKLARRNALLLAENAVRIDAEQRSTEAAELAAKEAERLRAFAKAADAKIAQAKSEAEARAAKDREQAQKAIDRALHAESKATESQQLKARAESETAIARRVSTEMTEAYNVAKSQRDWAYQRIQDLREVLTAAGVAVPAERPLGKL